MADITTAVEQDAVAESLLGDPQPVEQEAAGTESTELEAQPEQIEEQQTQEEQTDDWLPGEQEKVFPDDVLLQYAQRYQKDAEWLSDPLNRQLLHDKLNSDIYLRQQQEQQPFEVEPVAEQPTQQMQPTLEEHLASLSQITKQITNPQIAQSFANQFMKAFGVTEAAKPETAMALTEAMTTFGLNLLQSYLPQVLSPMLDSAMPGFSGMYFQSARASSWDSVRNSSPAFAELPAYGTREFVELCSKLDSDYPALTQMGIQLQNSNGGQLHGEAANKFYATVAQLATRQGNPQQLQQAAEAGARTARRGEVRRSAGNLGAGQSKGAIGTKTGSSRHGDNADIFDEGEALWAREHGKV